jgi:hypothetical protein
MDRGTQGYFTPLINILPTTWAGKANIFHNSHCRDVTARGLYRKTKILPTTLAGNAVISKNFIFSFSRTKVVVLVLKNVVMKCY